MATTTTTTKRAVRALCAAGLAMGLTACAQSDLIRFMIQLQLDKYWNDPAKKADAEDQAAAKVKTAVDAALDGKEFEVPGPNPYLHHVKWVDVGLGDVSPAIAIPGTPTDTQTTANHYVTFEWEARWARGNGATLDMGLDLRTHSFWTAYEYPDHDVHVRDIDAFAKGTAFVIVPKAGGPSTASLTLTGGTIDLSAQAEGWFWSVDVSNQIKGQVNDKVLRDLVGKALKVAFGA